MSVFNRRNHRSRLGKQAFLFKIDPDAVVLNVFTEDCDGSFSSDLTSDDSLPPLRQQTSSRSLQGSFSSLTSHDSLPPLRKQTSGRRLRRGWVQKADSLRTVDGTVSAQDEREFKILKRRLHNSIIQFENRQKQVNRRLANDLVVLEHLAAAKTERGHESSTLLPLAAFEVERHQRLRACLDIGRCALVECLEQMDTSPTLDLMEMEKAVDRILEGIQCAEDNIAAAMQNIETQ